MITNPVKAIRAFCVDCCGGSSMMVKGCSAPDCALYPFRLGKNPYRKSRELTEEERQVLRDRMNKIRKSPCNSLEKSDSSDIDLDYAAED